MLYGVDVAKSRIDDLDRLLLRQSSMEKATVLDLGCGSGGMSFKLGEAGAKVFAVDIEDYSKEFSIKLDLQPELKGKIQFIHDDMNNLASILRGQTFDYCLFQRSLHYLSYEAAVSLLHDLNKLVTDKMFISVTGLESDIGKSYPARTAVLSKRFAKLLPEEAKKFSIQAPLCLYQKEEFVDLLEQTGWKIDSISTSAFGNHKVVCH
jgi:SAM-dependent methyltransferase